MMKQQNLVQNAKANLNQLLARDLTTDFEVDDKIEINKDLKLADLQSKAQTQNTNLMITKKIIKFRHLLSMKLGLNACQRFN